MPTACDVTVVTDTRLYARGKFGISVLDYGADPTGVADSWIAFQRAIRDCWNDVWKNGNNYQGRAGGALFIPRGRYKISRTLEVSDSAAGTTASPKKANGVMLIGEGGQAMLSSGLGSVLFKSSYFVGDALVAIVGTQGFTMSGLMLDGSRTTQGSPATSGIILQNVGNPVLKDIIVVNNAAWGIWVANSNLYSLSGVMARNNGAGGIRLTSGMQAYSCYSLASNAGAASCGRLADCVASGNQGAQLEITQASESGSGSGTDGQNTVASNVFWGCTFESAETSQPAARIDALNKSVFVGCEFGLTGSGATEAVITLGSSTLLTGSLTVSPVDKVSFVSCRFDSAGSGNLIKYLASTSENSSGRRASFVDCKFAGGSSTSRFNFLGAKAVPASPAADTSTFYFDPRPSVLNGVGLSAVAYTTCQTY